MQTMFWVTTWHAVL